MDDERDHETVLCSMERKLAALGQELEHSQRLAMVGLMTAGIAHEVNNLLTPALSYARRLQEQPPHAPLPPRAADRIVSAIEAAAGILDAILGLSAAPGAKTAAEISVQLQAAVDCMGRDPARDGITLTRRIPPAMSVTIAPTALQQILLNLLLNARRALGGRGGEIRVSAVERPDGMTAITFADNGPGFPAEIADRVFEPFVTHHIDVDRSESQPARPQGGMGLGLAICRRAVEAAGGAITASTSQGRGATFLIQLPTAIPSKAARAG